ncbi:hypothetical protein CCP2SC5_1680001 [Azospirillaceae bacterium]
MPSGVASSRILAGTNVVVANAVSIAQIADIDRANRSGMVTYTALSDTIKNLMPSGVASSRILAGTNVAVANAASVAQITAIDRANSSGMVTYTTLSDTVENLTPFGIASSRILAGTNVVVANAASVAQIAAIDRANRSGMVTYATLSDTVENLTPFGVASSRILAGTNVVVTNAASVAQITAIDRANSSGMVTYSLIDSAENLASSLYVKSGINVTISGSATTTQISAIDSKNITGVISWQVNETTNLSRIFNVTNLMLTGNSNINGTGNLKANIITGNSGTNTLFGGGGNDILVGGVGRDTLIGGTGNDVFRYVSSSEGGDTITDFVRGTDKIQLVSSNFGNITSSQIIAGSAFVSNSTGSAVGSLNQLIFNTSNGNLYYDADGVGAGSSVLLASLNVRTLSASDILVASS